MNIGRLTGISAQTGAPLSQILNWEGLPPR